MRRLDDARADETRLRALGDETAKLLIEANDNSPRETIVVDGVTIDAETGEIVDEPPREAEAPRTENEASRRPAGAKPADSDEAGHAFQYEAGHLFRSEAGQRSDLMSAAGGLLPRIEVDDVSVEWIGQERFRFSR